MIRLPSGRSPGRPHRAPAAAASQVEPAPDVRRRSTPRGASWPARAPRRPPRRAVVGAQALAVPLPVPVPGRADRPRRALGAGVLDRAASTRSSPSSRTSGSTTSGSTATRCSALARPSAGCSCSPAPCHRGHGGAREPHQRAHGWHPPDVIEEDVDDRPGPGRGAASADVANGARTRSGPAGGRSAVAVPTGSGSGDGVAPRRSDPLRSSDAPGL